MSPSNQTRSFTNEAGPDANPNSVQNSSRVSTDGLITSLSINNNASLSYSISSTSSPVHFNYTSDSYCHPEDDFDESSFMRNSDPTPDRDMRRTNSSYDDKNNQSLLSESFLEPESDLRRASHSVSPRNPYSEDSHQIEHYSNERDDHLSENHDGNDDNRYNRENSKNIKLDRHVSEDKRHLRSISDNYDYDSNISMTSSQLELSFDNQIRKADDEDFRTHISRDSQNSFRNRQNLSANLRSDNSQSMSGNSQNMSAKSQNSSGKSQNISGRSHSVSSMSQKSPLTANGLRISLPQVENREQLNHLRRETTESTREGSSSTALTTGTEDGYPFGSTVTSSSTYKRLSNDVNSQQSQSSTSDDIVDDDQQKSLNTRGKGSDDKLCNRELDGFSNRTTQLPSIPIRTIKSTKLLTSLASLAARNDSITPTNTNDNQLTNLTSSLLSTNSRCNNTSFTQQQLSTPNTKITDTDITNSIHKTETNTISHTADCSNMTETITHDKTYPTSMNEMRDNGILCVSNIPYSNNQQSSRSVKSFRSATEELFRLAECKSEDPHFWQQFRSAMEEHNRILKAKV